MRRHPIRFVRHGRAFHLRRIGHCDVNGVAGFKRRESTIRLLLIANRAAIVSSIHGGTKRKSLSAHIAAPRRSSHYGSTDVR